MHSRSNFICRFFQAPCYQPSTGCQVQFYTTTQTMIFFLPLKSINTRHIAISSLVFYYLWSYSLYHWASLSTVNSETLSASQYDRRKTVCNVKHPLRVHSHLRFITRLRLWLRMRFFSMGWTRIAIAKMGAQRILESNGNCNCLVNCKNGCTTNSWV